MRLSICAFAMFFLTTITVSDIVITVTVIVGRNRHCGIMEKAARLQK